MGSKYSQMIAYIKRIANNDLGWFIEFLNQYAWSIEVIMIMLMTLLLAYVEHVMYHKLHPEFLKKKKLWQHAFIHALHRPLFCLIWLVGLSFSLELCIDFLSKNNPNFFLASIRKVGILSLVVWFAISYIQEIERLFLSRKEDGHFVDKTTIRAVGQIMRIIVLLGGAFFILQTTLGVGASAVVAFAGGGSFIIGWAAKDMLANVFGGFMIFLDRPFVIGDKISTLDKEFEGYVEQIGWRLTCIRTLEKVPVYIPNSYFSSSSIQNPSRMTHRRIYATIGLRHQDGNKIAAILKDVETMLHEHIELDTSEPTYANFINFGQNSLDILVCAYTFKTNLQEFYKVRQDVFFKIMTIIASHEAMCAYPVTEGYLKVSLENAQR